MDKMTAIDEVKAERDLLVELVTELSTKLDKATRELEELKRDDLMKIYTRRELFKEYEREFKRTKRHGDVLSVIMIDIDHFKLVNDTHGHLIGDVILYEVAQLVSNKIRESDRVCRYGGEEIMVFLPDTDTIGAYKVAEKIRKAIESNFFSEKQIPITISLGVAEYNAKTAPKNEDHKEVIKRADDALYIAKREGRNQTITASE